MTFTPQPAIAWSDVEQALVDWANEVTDLEVVWSGEDGPQPNRPYVALDWVSMPSRVGDDYYVDTAVTATAEIERELAGVREATLNVQVFSSSRFPGENAAYYCDMLVSSLLSYDLIATHFKPNRMAPWSTEPIQPGAFAEDQHAISRAGFDMKLGFSAGTGAVIERIPYFTTVAITGTVSFDTVADLAVATTSSLTA